MKRTKFKKFKEYRTGLITSKDELSRTRPYFNGAGWKAAFVLERRNPNRVYQGLELLMYARSWDSAQRALNLIFGCHRVIDGDPLVIDFHPIAHNLYEPEWVRENKKAALFKNYCSMRNFPPACAIAARASRRRQWVYAVAKYMFSLSLYSVHHVDLKPFTSSHLKVSVFPDDHIMFSHAIISAYSAIEDLGLEVRASSKKPSRINNRWNPVVRADLEHRLASAGVNLKETVLWTARGPKRRIEKKRMVSTVCAAPWARWPVRDAELHIVDAIAYADWLRDCVASHSVKGLTRALSPYDVINVQHLARRLLMESLGFWRWHERTELKYK